MYHLVTGHNPGTTPFCLPPIWQLNAQLGERAGALIDKAIQIDPRHRYTSPTDMAKAISQAMATKSKPAKVSDRIRKGGTQRLSKVPFGAGGSQVVDLSAPEPVDSLSFTKVLLVASALFALIGLMCGYLYMKYLM